MVQTSVSEELAKKVLSRIDKDRVVAFASKLISIPSWTREGQKEAAKYCATYMQRIGMQTELQEITLSKGESTQQAIGRFTGSEQGPSLLLCSHLDTDMPYKPDLWTKQLGQIEEGWIYGVGGQKCGIAAMLEAARAVNRSVKLRGDLIVACVAEEKTGGIGIQRLLEEGMKPDMAIVGEDSDLQLVTVSVAGIFGTIHIDGRPDRPKGAGGINAIKKMLRLVKELKPFQPASPEGWLTFQSHRDLPGYPRFNIISIEAQPPQYPTSCSILFDCRIVPGQSEETVRRDLKVLLDDLRIHDPDLIAQLEIPTPGWLNRQPFETSSKAVIVETVARWHGYIVGTKPHIGAGIRLGFASDANNLKAAGVDCVNYGPGDFQEPVNERKKIEDMMKAAGVYALTATETSG